MSSVHKSSHLLHAVTFKLCYIILYRLEYNDFCRRENEAAFHNPTGDKLGNTRVTIYLSSRFVLQIRFLSSPSVYKSFVPFPHNEWRGKTWNPGRRQLEKYLKFTPGQRWTSDKLIWINMGFVRILSISSQAMVLKLSSSWVMAREYLKSYLYDLKGRAWKVSDNYSIFTQYCHKLYHLLHAVLRDILQITRPWWTLPRRKWSCPP